jgi:hypothetical protein
MHPILTTCGLILFFAFCPNHLRADWYLLPEPKFMAHDIVWPIAGSTQTVLLPVRIPGSEPEALTLTQTKNPALSRSQILNDAQKNASSFFATLTPTLVRDDRGVIRYAVLESTDPRLATCVLAPEFTEQFLETIGPDALIAIPNRNRIYIFPRSDVPGAELSERIFIDYRSSNHPISREVFETKEGTLRAVGTLK